MIRNQFMQSNPFKNCDEYVNKDLKSNAFKKTYKNICYHYTQLMSTLDTLSSEAKAITDTYKENV